MPRVCRPRPSHGKCQLRAALADVDKGANDLLAIAIGTSKNLVLPAEVHIPPALLDRVYSTEDQMAQDSVLPILEMSTLSGPVALSWNSQDDIEQAQDIFDQLGAEPLPIWVEGAPIWRW